jgi:hypothetical protein
MLLENARIGTPCAAKWDAMAGDARVRFCEACGMNVYNLSALPRAEAESLLAEREGRICIRLYTRADGTVMTADCPVGLRRVKLRRVVAAVVGLSAVTLTAAAMVTRHATPLSNAVTPAVVAAEDTPEPVFAAAPEPPPAMDDRPEPAPPPPPVPPRKAAVSRLSPKVVAPKKPMIMGEYAF